MSHHIYHTEGFVVGSVNTGEANKYLTLFTRELGVVRAAAQSVRHLKSKLRFALQDLAYARVDLVRGRELWRVTSATHLPLYTQVREHKDTLLVYTRVLSLVRRLSQGEESHEALFDDVCGLFRFIESHELTKAELEACEVVGVIRILSRLGYVGNAKEHATFIEEELSLSLVQNAHTMRAFLVSLINSSLRESQL
jgi:DNA repair protein RecO (recombination protein O)